MAKVKLNLIKAIAVNAASITANGSFSVTAGEVSTYKWDNDCVVSLYVPVVSVRVADKNDASFLTTDLVAKMRTSAQSCYKQFDRLESAGYNISEFLKTMKALRQIINFSNCLTALLISNIPGIDYDCTKAARVSLDDSTVKVCDIYQDKKSGLKSYRLPLFQYRIVEEREVCRPDAAHAFYGDIIRSAEISTQEALIINIAQQLGEGLLTYAGWIKPIQHNVAKQLDSATILTVSEWQAAIEKDRKARLAAALEKLL